MGVFMRHLVDGGGGGSVGAKEIMSPMTPSGYDWYLNTQTALPPTHQQYNHPMDVGGVVVGIQHHQQYQPHQPPPQPAQPPTQQLVVATTKPESETCCDTCGLTALLNVSSANNAVSTDTPTSAEPPPCCPFCPCAHSSCCSQPGSLCRRIWCRLSVLLLLIVLLLIVFLLISGILLYLNYIPYKARAPLKEEPCEKTYCGYGAGCHVDSHGRASCQCPECKDIMVFTPVCGTDGVTYTSECLLKMKSCRQQKIIRIRHPGECDAPDPCETKQCPYGATCVASMDGRTASCECPSSCPDYGDNEDGQPVCGSDGRDYKNQCDMRKHSCEKNRIITVKFVGRCDPCEDVTCPEEQLCQIDDKRRPLCRCHELCSMEFQPVCGSDGRTYANDCVMKQEACRLGKILRIIYRGKCSSGVNPCESVRCSEYQECEIDRYGIAQCKCQETCEAVVRPVCASDQVTYDNICEMRKAACNLPRTLNLVYAGTCEHMGPCASYMCKHGAICVERMNRPECECPACSAEFSPVCGSDGISYNNDCKLRLESCQQKKDIKVLYKGLCNGCENKHCDFYAVCESDGITAKCICPEACVETRTPVCGTDDVTYASECELRVSACKKQQFIVVATRGDCDLCQHVKCKFGARCESGVCVCPTECPATYEPVCASDVKTYDNECDMQKSSCPLARPLHVHFYGECKEGFASGIGNSAIVGVAAVPPPPPPPTSSNMKSCKHSPYGCCPDGRTNALAPKHGGCPSICNCNKLGSYGESCDPISGQCTCKPGVGGEQCDRCEPGYWGLPKISEGNSGCIPCGCSQFGSVRDDCEQMTGRCVCKPGIRGQKCNTCPKTYVLGPYGCMGPDSSTPIPATCEDLPCFFGATCEMHDGHAECVCRVSCPDDSDKLQDVCGSDGQTYGSDCQLRLFACRFQKDIVVHALGACTEDSRPTDTPFRRSTALRYTEAGYVSSPVAKSTRHLSPEQLATNLFVENYFSYRPTPATVQVQGFLGDVCISDLECATQHSQCVKGRCLCAEGFTSSFNRQDCLTHTPPIHPTVQLSSCSSQPCQGGGSCLESEDEDGFTCICPGDRAGTMCQHVSGIKSAGLPAFDGRSFVELRKLVAYMKLSIEIEFKTFANDGILLYAQQRHDGTGDFVSVAIVNGHVEFRYNLGNGAVILRSPHRVKLRHFHRVVAKRYQRDGMLKLDDSEDVAGQSQGSLKALDLSENAFVGYVPEAPNKVFENIGTNSGLIGCIRKLKIGRRVIDLIPSSSLLRSTTSGFPFPSPSTIPEVNGLIIRSEGIGECGDNPCASVPCLNHGTCMPVDSHRFHCTCQPGFRGDVCETMIDPCLSNPCSQGSTCSELPHGGFVCKCPPGRKGRLCQEIDTEMSTWEIPAFNGNSYLELNRLEGIGKAFSLELWFLTHSPDGVLLFDGQEGARGDFIEVALRKGHLTFRYDLGSGSANITSPDVVTMNEWHVAKVSRVDKEGSLQMDNGLIVTGSSQSPLTELNLELPLFIGGIRHTLTLPRDMGEPVGFHGAVQRLMVNGDILSNLMGRAVGRVEVEPFNGPPCGPNPCHNHGVCHPHLDQFICKCSHHYTGSLCEKRIEASDLERPVRFTGQTFLKFPNRINKIPTNTTNLSFTDWEVIEGEYEDEYEDGDYFDEFEYGEVDLSDEWGGEVETEEDSRRGQKRNRFELNFRTTESNGLLLWINRGTTLRGDYYAVALIDGFIEYSFNLGSQRSFFVLRSKVRADDGQWHQLFVQRKKRVGILRIDDESPIKGVSEQGATSLNTDGFLWIGGAPTLPSGLPAGYYLGFKGCADSVLVDKRKLHMVKHGENTVTQFCHD